MPCLSSLRWRFPQKPVSGPPAQTPVGLMGRVQGMMVCFSFFRENRVGLNNRDTLSMATISQLELQRLQFLYTTVWGGNEANKQIPKMHLWLAPKVVSVATDSRVKMPNFK